EPCSPSAEVPRRENDVQSITTHPAHSPAKGSAPAPGLFSSPLFVRVHLALTALLMASLLAVAVLVVTGLLHFGVQAASAAGDADEPDKVAQKQDGEKEKPKEKPPEKPKEGRYQIELVDEAREAVNVSLA